MSNTQDSNLLEALKTCKNIACGKIIDHKILNQGLASLTQLVRSCDRKTTVNMHLESFLQFMILDVNLDWITLILDDFGSNGWISLSKLFLECSPDSALLSLLAAFSELSPGARQELCLRLLELFFKHERFVTLMLESTIVGDKGMYEKTIFQNVLTSLNALPNKVANNTLGKFSDTFHYERFFQLLAVQTGDVIQKLTEKVRKGKDVSTNSISQLLGLFCFSGKADTFLGVLLPLFVSKCWSDFLWRKVVFKIMSGLPDRYLEACVTYIAKEVPWHGCMKWFFEDLILRSSRLKFLLLHKLILVKHFPSSQILKNILGYIADNSLMRYLLIETIKKLLSVWADSSAIRHVSYEQHKYVTQAILICTGLLTKELLELHGQDLNMWLVPGMSSHLDSTDFKLRRLGMVVGEAIALKTDCNGNHKLEFGYEKDEETESMMKLLTPDPSPPDSYFEELMNSHDKTKQEITIQIKKEQSNIKGAVKTFTTTKAAFLEILSNRSNTVKVQKNRDSEDMNEEEQRQEELDSDDEEDDDLQPYDMSNDTIYRKVKPPAYIRDCMEGLAERENREKFEVSFNTVKNLIQRNPVAAKEVAIELCKVLLDLDNVFALEDFSSVRLSAMTELAVVDPEKVAGFLTREFYAEEYCLQHRLDILDVLTAAARILSSVEKGKDQDNIIQKAKEIQESLGTETWREIVDKRIEAKTRRFGKGKSKFVVPKENKFGPVAGCFFYPLLAGYDKRIRTLDLLGNDAIVLGRLLYSVGMILYSAINTMAAHTMTKSLLDFALEMRFHPEAYVRQAILFCVSMATITSGEHLLGCEAFDEITEWVHETLTNDTNTRTKQLAAQTALTMSKKLSKEVKSGF